MVRRPKRTCRVPAKFRDSSTPVGRINNLYNRSKRFNGSYSVRCRTPRNKTLVARRSPKRRIRKPAPACIGGSGHKYPVDRVLKHSVTKFGFTKFRVKWLPPHEGSSWEPIENLQEVPLLIQKYVKVKELQFRARLRKQLLEASVVPFQFPKIPKSFEGKLRVPGESYIPHGAEVLEKVWEEIDVEKGRKLWLVQFRGFENLHHVNKERIVYYFPLLSCLFVNECSLFDDGNKD